MVCKPKIIARMNGGRKIQMNGHLQYPNTPWAPIKIPVAAPSSRHFVSDQMQCNVFFWRSRMGFCFQGAERTLQYPKVVGNSRAMTRTNVEERRSRSMATRKIQKNGEEKISANRYRYGCCLLCFVPYQAQRNVFFLIKIHRIEVPMNWRGAWKQWIKQHYVGW